MIVHDMELYLAGVHLPRACCTREATRVHVWRRGGAYRKARRQLRAVKALRTLADGAERVSPWLGMEVRINPSLRPDDVFLFQGRTVVAGRRAFAEEARSRSRGKE